MKERPIIFSTEMVKAILEGRKTQTRRVIKPQPDLGLDPFDSYSHIEVGNYHPALIDKDGESYPGDEIFGAYTNDGEWGWRCPYGQPGDRMWVRETFAVLDYVTRPQEFVYKADGHVPPPIIFRDKEVRQYWKPSIHMPRWASRIDLEIVSVRVERVQEISDEDAKAEGSPSIWLTGKDGNLFDSVMPTFWFEDRWDSLNAKRGRIHRWEDDDGILHVERIYENFGWEVNPWVWVIEFKVT